MPLFLELVRKAGESDPALARRALAGLRSYELAERGPARPLLPDCARIDGVCLRDHGGSGPVALLVPSLINPPRILDLDQETSLAEAVKAMGRRVLLLDWGRADGRTGLSVTAHIEHYLVPLIEAIGEPPALIGYCLGGTMAIAAANLIRTERVATLASPWHFGAYPADSRAALDQLWAHSRAGAESLGSLPMELLQAAFWSLDPLRTVSKFAEFDELDPGSPPARRFVALEDWANGGEALPYPAAKELIEHLFGADLPGRGRWHVGGRAIRERLDVPLLTITAANDRIAPAATATKGPALAIDSGHVGMVVGSKRRQLHRALAGFLGESCRSG